LLARTEDEPTAARKVKRREPADSTKVECSVPTAGVEVKHGRTSPAVGLTWTYFFYGRSDGQSFVCFFAWIASMDSCTLIGCDRE
jgi:hypothetical protein